MKIPPSWHLSPTAISEAFFIERDNQNKIPLGKTLPHFTGQIYVQSLSSMLPVIALDPQPEEKILDLAAAPGSKTTFLSQQMQNTGVIVANEPSSSRSAKLAANLDRMGAMNAVITQYDGSLLNKFFVQEFDHILLDAPCSSEGYGRKQSDFFQKMWSEKKIFQAAKLQKKLILSAFQMLRPGGTLLYSTCTSAPEENEAVVQFLRDHYPDAVQVVPMQLGNIPTSKGLSSFRGESFHDSIAQNALRIWPQKKTQIWNSEIFFLAKIQKKTSLSLSSPAKIPPSGAFRILGKNQTAEILTRWKKTFGIEKEYFQNLVFLEKNKAYFLTSRSAASFALRNPHRRCGLPVLDKHGNITSAFALHFGKYATQNVRNLSPEEKDRWLEGYDVPLGKTDILSEEILVQYEGFCLGHGKIHNHMLKNKLDRSLVF